jgi:alpha,alpha-trehalase
MNEKARKEKMNELCWNEESSMYFDYDFVKRNTIPFGRNHIFFLVGWNVRQHQAKISEVALPQF